MAKSLGPSERAIVVYSPHNRLRVSILLCILVIVGFLFLIRLAASNMFTKGTFSPLSFLTILLILLEIWALILFVGAVIFNVRRLISHEAALTIDAQGITISDYFPLGHIWLPWADIADLYTRNPSYSYLYIRLKNLDKFTRNYHPIQRFLFRGNPFYKGAPITIPAVFLAIPVPQILTQIRDRFGDELYRHQVSVQM